MRYRLIPIAAAVAMFELALFVAGYLVYWIIARPGDLDFGSQYGAAYVAVHHGWSHLYDLPLLHEFEIANHLDGLAPFQHPPPVAWLALPFLLLPLRWAALVWQALLLVALVAAALLVVPARRWDRTLALLTIAGFQPVLFALGYGTMSPLVFLLLVGTLRALEGERPVIAGVLLGLTAVKPQLTLLVVPVLLAAGYWKTALTGAGVMAGLALVSAAVIGPSGTRDYLSFLVSPDALNHQMPWTVKALVGAGAPSFVATAVVVIAAAAVAIRLRPRPDVALSLGILSSLFVAQHINVGDFVLWLLPIWLAFRAGQPAWLRAVAVITWIAGWFVVGIPIVGAVMDVAFAIAFVFAASSASRSGLSAAGHSAFDRDRDLSSPTF
jgi:hypothetical protein